VSDVTKFLSGSTMSYVEFSQGMIRNKTLLSDIYDTIYSKGTTTTYDQIKEIAAEHGASVVKDQQKKNRTKKAKLAK
jgi:hypothetical protein